MDGADEAKGVPARWGMGILNDRFTHEVPGSVLLLTGNHNEPLGTRNAPARMSTSSVTPTAYPVASRSHSNSNKKKTPDGAIILEPQPDDSHNDPLNWPVWRRNTALLSLGIYCMIGGGMTPILAAGFTNVASDFDVTVSKVALTTGLYMMGMGVGSVFASPTAILYGKRPVYLFGCVLFIGCSAWCAASPSYGSLAAARVFQGFAISPVECLPSATIAEIFFLHERAYRIGVYTLLLLGGKNLIPLVSAAIIQRLSWRWVFWIVAMVGGFGFALLFLFVPETFWDRSPVPRDRSQTRRSSFWERGLDSVRRMSARSDVRRTPRYGSDGAMDGKAMRKLAAANTKVQSDQKGQSDQAKHVGFAEDDSSVSADTMPKTAEAQDGSSLEKVETSAAPQDDSDSELMSSNLPTSAHPKGTTSMPPTDRPKAGSPNRSSPKRLGAPTSLPLPTASLAALAHHEHSHRVTPTGLAPPTPGLHNYNSPFYVGLERSNSDYLERGRESLVALDIRSAQPSTAITPPSPDGRSLNTPFYVSHEKDSADSKERGRGSFELQRDSRRSVPNETSLAEMPTVVDNSKSESQRPTGPQRYTTFLRHQPKQTFVQQLKPFNGRLHRDNWFRVAVRPFILYCYPAVLWSSIVYSCSIGWLIVLSESVAEIYRSRDTYNFTALQTGLVYIAPFIGGVLGTAVAGKVSDIIVRFMSRRNGGLYEPEFRLVMAIPIAITTAVGLMGFGWSAQERDAWIVPTVFFGVISFGCSLGSTTAITFCVDSYRQYAGEALVTLNFSKNIFHGLVFSLFFNNWLTADGSKKVFIAIGGIQLGLLCFTIPMYIYGKRLRMWTVRRNLMEKF